jgi:hypothetical protein
VTALDELLAFRLAFFEDFNGFLFRRRILVFMAFPFMIAIEGAPPHALPSGGKACRPGNKNSVQEAEDKKYKNDRKRNADQPKQKPTSHCRLLRKPKANAVR